MTGQKLVSRTDFAKAFGISQGAVTKLCRKTIAAACVGKRIDMGHPSVAVYAAKKAQRDNACIEKTLEAAEAAAAVAPPAQVETPVAQDVTTTKIGAPVKPARAKGRKASPLISDGFMQPPDDEELGKFGNMKLSTILKKYGTMTQFKDLLSASKTIEDIHAKRIANAKASGDLISRTLVNTHVFGAMEALLVRLIQDSPRTIVARVVAAHESGETIEECEIIVRDLQSTQIKGMKKEVTKGLKSA
jgi:hypothetical protein